MKKTIYIIRHGETDFNRRGVVQGSGIDADLNDTGRTQAACFYDFYKTIPFQKIYTSALKRTSQSVQSFLDAGFKHEVYGGLNEVSWGIREGLPMNYDEQNYYHWLTTQWVEGNTHIPAEGGESPEQVRVRIQNVLDVIIGRKDESLILVAMHGRALRILLTTILNQPLAAMDDYAHSNLCLYLVEYDYTTQQYSIIKANDTEHLK